MLVLVLQQELLLWLLLLLHVPCEAAWWAFPAEPLKHLFSEDVLETRVASMLSCKLAVSVDHKQPWCRRNGLRWASNLWQLMATYDLPKVSLSYFGSAERSIFLTEIGGCVILANMMACELQLQLLSYRIYMQLSWVASDLSLVLWLFVLLLWKCRPKAAPKEALVIPLLLHYIIAVIIILFFLFLLGLILHLPLFALIFSSLLLLLLLFLLLLLVCVCSLLVLIYWSLVFILFSYLMSLSLSLSLFLFCVSLWWLISIVSIVKSLFLCHSLSLSLSFDLFILP